MDKHPYTTYVPEEKSTFLKDPNQVWLKDNSQVGRPKDGHLNILTDW
jgi:hypothetical protein